MGTKTNKGEIDDLEIDFANLARLAASDAQEDTRLLLARLIRKYRQQRPELASLLDQSLKASQTRSAGNAILRRGAPITDAGEAPLPVDGDSRLALIRVFDDRVGLPPPILPGSVHDAIGAIIRERQERERLAARGISPTRSAILVGPPGVGKTLSARWIASALGKPLWVLDLTAVMSSLLGKTGNNLRAALDHAKQHAAVLLLDEIDAIAKRRSDESDIGELKRLVTVMLQEVDQWPDTGLLLAATNHPELVDPALWRRFDLVLKFDAPDAAAIATAIQRFLGDDLTLFASWIDVLAAGLQGQSLSDVERSINALRRGHALQMAPLEQLIGSALGQRQEALSKAERLNLAIALAKAGRHTHMQISQMTGVARDTIRKHAGPSPRKGRGLK
ncbi:MAG TPA: ATPase [Thauera sp.]|uniref:AAA family ATPase n=2 Tax=Pseudomonadota TaxID=1224 RepID=UPI000EC9C593|nr:MULTISPECIES: ATP-binding protein [Betaproteobacteria incertae sedis]MBP8276201.1 AAA family ATPase [Propionivibrio sp.]TXG95199.1 MAG: AAA family ATPase [Rhodocyclaceae bacterium]HAF54916.1 ATPase [Thauera sp.]HHW65323.1 AAA family ATPase [Rhodocyclaceae bacterium]HPU80568.1 ATP-binding protein [Accumulibacter sp.]